MSFSASPLTFTADVDVTDRRAEPAAAPRPPSNWEQVRTELLRAAIPPSYRPLLHLVLPSTLGLVGILAMLWFVHDLKPIQLLAIPVTYVLALGLEWRVHRDLLHKRVKPLQELYDRHERMHHVVFPAEDMGIRSRREVGLVLMPKIAIVGVFVLMMPLAAIVWYFTSRNVALLVVVTGLVFFLAYEWMHLLYHMPAESWLGRRFLVARLRALHQRHHEPRYMKRWNFNVTLPLFDVLHGTLWSPAKAAKRDADR